MTDSWDRKNPTLDANIAAAGEAMAAAARSKAALTAEQLCEWHSLLMNGLEADRPEDRAFLEGIVWRGRFRGQNGDLSVNVGVGHLPGVHFEDVPAQLANSSKALPSI